MGSTKQCNGFSITNVKKFSEATKQNRASLYRKLDGGYKLGKLNGKVVLYNPKSIIEVAKGFKYISKSIGGVKK